MKPAGPSSARMTPPTRRPLHRRLGSLARLALADPDHSPLEGESQKPSRQAKADAEGGGGSGAGARRSIILSMIRNMDRQDKQDGKLLQAKLTRAMIRCGFKVINELGSGFSESLLKKR